MDKKSLYKQILFVSLPIVIQNLLDAAVNAADVLMINTVGQSAISATSLAVQYSTIYHMVLYGIGTGITMLSAQYFGKGDERSVETVEGIGLRFSTSIAMFFALCMLTIPRLMMKVFTNDVELITLGASYLRILAPGYLIWSFCAVYISTLRCTNRVTQATVLEAIALAVNVCLNAVFIFGLFGLPKMGVFGVGLATTISRVVELIGCIIVSEKTKGVKLNPLAAFRKAPLLTADFLKMALPAVLNDVVWSVAFSMYSVILGHMGNDAVAANSITSTVRNLGSVVCFGCGSAGGIIVGQILGRDEINEAKHVANIFFGICAITGILGGGVVLAVMPFALKHAALTETALGYLKGMMLINSYYILGQSVNTLLIAGIFRAGGDSKYGLICDIIDMWVYAVPLGFLAAFVLKLPVLWVYFLLCTDEFVKWPFVFAHYFKYKWAKNITRDAGELEES